MPHRLLSWRGPPPVHRLRRPRALRGPRMVVLLAVLGPGLLAGLSDDDPAGITTYSILGADYGYQMLWVLLLSVVALIVFHELGARMGIATGRGLAQLIRDRFGGRWAIAAMGALVVANLGTCAAEFAGIAAAGQLVGVPVPISVLVAAGLVCALVLGGSFHRVEHVLLLLACVFVSYAAAAVLSHPDWGAAAHGLVVPGMPLTDAAVLAAVATVGTTLAPWGLAFIQSSVVDKGVTSDELGDERVDVIVGSVLTGVIGAFVVIACAATLHVAGTHVDDASDAAVALRPVAGSAASALFGVGLLGASLLAAAVVPLSTAYSVSEALEAPGRVGEGWRAAPQFHIAFVSVVAVGAVVVAIPGVSLVPILFGTQAINAILLLPLLVFLRLLASDRELMGRHVLGRFGRVATLLTLLLVGASVIALGVLAVV